MAKSLGQIHTANQKFSLLAPSVGNKYLLDAAQILTDQLQRQVRQGNYFKTVGIDMVLRSNSNTEGGEVAGRIKYYAPTRGRCAAYRAGFKAMAETMKNQGISMRDNAQYDFRVLPSAATLENVTDIINIASFDGVNSLNNGGSGANALFDVHNSSVEPKQTGTPAFATGFGVYGSATDFVLNEGLAFSGNEDYAEPSFEQIPFTASYTPASDTAPIMFQWRPDPALYLAVMNGHYIIEIDAIDYDGGAVQLELDVAVHIAGWKSIMGDPDKKRRRSRRSNGNSSHGNKTSTTTTVTTVKK